MNNLKEKIPCVCILCGDPFSGYHGSYKQTFLQASEISKRGIPIIMISPKIDSERYGLKVEKQKIDKFEFWVISSKLFHNKLIKIISLTLYLFWIQKKYNIIQITTNHFSFTGFLLSLLFKKRFVIVTTSFRGYLVKSGMLQKIKMFSISKADVLVTKTDQLYHYYNKNVAGSSKVIKIPNGVDINRFTIPSQHVKQKAKKQLGFEHTDKIILFVGNILKEKGIDILIDLFIKRKNNLRNLRLILVGNKNLDKHFTQDISQKIIQNGLMNNVFLSDPVNNIELYYIAADIFILPSRREGLPNVVLEAMACGLPCIVSKLGYTDELIDGKNGYVLDIYHQHDLWEKIVELSRNEEKRRKIGLNARKTIDEKYSISSVVNRYGALYRDLSLDG